MAAATHLLLFSLAFLFLFVEAPVDGPEYVQKMPKNNEDCDGVFSRPDIVDDDYLKWKRLQLPADQANSNSSALYVQLINYGGSATGIAYYALPMMAYHFTTNWEIVFYDAFHPTSIWLDVASSLSQEAFHLFLCDNFLDRLDLIVPELCGSMVLLIGLYTYVTRKQDGDPNLTQTMKNCLVWMLIIWFWAPWLLFLAQLDHKGHFRHEVGVGLLCFIGLCEVAQIFYPLAIRMFHNTAADNPFPVRLTKIAAATCQMLSAGADVFAFVVVKGYWSAKTLSPEWSALWIGMVKCGCAVVLVIARSIGPRNFVDWCNSFVTVVKKGRDALTTGVKKACAAVKKACSKIADKFKRDNN